jgi:hypothetical protein
VAAPDEDVWVFSGADAIGVVLNTLFPRTHSWPERADIPRYVDDAPLSRRVRLDRMLGSIVVVSNWYGVTLQVGLPGNLRVERLAFFDDIRRKHACRSAAVVRVRVNRSRRNNKRLPGIEGHC